MGNGQNLHDKTILSLYGFLMLDLVLQQFFYNIPKFLGNQCGGSLNTLKSNNNAEQVVF